MKKKEDHREDPEHLPLDPDICPYDGAMTEEEEFAMNGAAAVYAVTAFIIMAIVATVFYLTYHT